MTIDCGKSGLSKYRTEADNNLKQTCYFAQKKKDRLFDEFTAVNLNQNNLIFSIQTDTKNAIKDRHLLYNLLAEKQDDSEENKDDTRNITRKRTGTEQNYKRRIREDGTKTRKRPGFPLSR